MSVNLEVKGTLAKLLATEDLLIEHKKVQTASFDVERRVLTLPIWDLASNQVVDLLVSHEVGHALFTPNEDWTEKVQIPKNYVNVAEDVRVEKLMKRKYLGISKTFYRGYQELNQLDFFSVDGVDLDSMNLADRINLHFKIGAFLGIKFTPEEQEVVDVVGKAETFDDALAAAEVMYTFCKARAEEEKEKEATNQKSGQDSEEGSPSATEDSSESDSSGDDTDPDTSTNSGGSSGTQSRDGNPDIDDGIPGDGTSVDTMESLNQKMKDLMSNNQYSDSHYLEIPKFPLEDLVISNPFVLTYVNKFWDKVYEDLDNPFERIDAELAKYKKSAEKEVNYLVKEFECKKAADSYARASVAKTGVLDTSKLHTYKYNDDIFRKITVIPDGKNHGLVFLLDWSGSMGDYLLNTVKQVLNLVWFCKKVGIPFRVYAFTNSWYVERSDHWEPQKHLLKDPESNTIWADDDFRLIEFLTSEGNSKDFEKQVKTFWRLTKANSRCYDNPHIPVGFQLSGTPLYTALCSLNSVLPAFQEKYGLQKVHTVVLTDGESEALTYTSYRETRYGDRRAVRCQIRSGSTYLRDRKLGTTYSLQDYQHQQTSIMQNLKDRFPSMNFIGIRLCYGRDFGSMVRWWTEQSASPEMSSKWKKEKSISLDIGNYTKFFAISAGDLGGSSEFEVESDATKSQIRSAFKKSLQKSKFNRKILSEFVELVA